MRLSDHVRSSRVVTLRGRSKEEVLAELVRTAGEASEVRDGDALLRAILEREGILSTGIGLGIAVPHAKIPEVTDFVIAIGVSREGVDFDALDGKPAHIIVLIAAPTDRQRDYLALLAQVTVVLKQAETRQRLVEAADDPAEVHRLLASAARRP
jgi:mannitol/fructose-specific phosphotransferase system IIA component (Ntr-type)